MGAALSADIGGGGSQCGYRWGRLSVRMYVGAAPDRAQGAASTVTNRPETLSFARLFRGPSSMQCNATDVLTGSKEHSDNYETNTRG